MRKFKFKIEFILEIFASFLLVFFYTLFIVYSTSILPSFGVFSKGIFYFLLYFVILLLFSGKITVHILPLISFIEFLKTEKAGNFIYRISGQFAGALIGTILHIWILKFGKNIDYSFYANPLHPFLTGLFTGILAQVIYFAYLIIHRLGLKKIIKYFILSIALGSIFLIITHIESITLLNPFGLLMHYLFNGQQLTIELFFIGLTVHVITPMAFITGTHYFIKGYILKEKNLFK